MGVSKFHTNGVIKQLKMHRACKSLTSSPRYGGSEDKQQQIKLETVFKQHEKFHKDQHVIEKREIWEITGLFGAKVKFSRAQTHETETVLPELCKTFHIG